jgi:hypothetical protein
MKIAKSVRKEVTHGGVIPRGWQLAWYEPRRRVGVYYPAPLHWIARVTRELLRRARLAMRAPGIEHEEVFQMQRLHKERERLADEYARGYLSGWRECFQTCLTAVEEEISHADRTWDIGAFLTDSTKRSAPEN